MPYELTWEPRGVYRRYFGAVTIAERLHSFERICADPRFDALRYSITDYLAVITYEIKHEATEEIAALHYGAMQTNPRIAIAAVVVNPEIIAAIQHFISLKYVVQPYRIFASVDAARSWAERQKEQFVLPPTRPIR